MEKLAPQIRAAFLREFPDWREVPGADAVARRFVFKDFNRAFAFMARVAMLAEKLDHHPEWFNVYGTVDVTLSTHEVGGVTEKDVEMAAAMEEYAAGLLNE